MTEQGMSDSADHSMLPEEIWLNILLKVLGGFNREMVQCARVCSYWRQMILELTSKKLVYSDWSFWAHRQDQINWGHVLRHQPNYSSLAEYVKARKSNFVDIRIYARDFSSHLLRGVWLRFGSCHKLQKLGLISRCNALVTSEIFAVLPPSLRALSLGNIDSMPGNGLLLTHLTALTSLSLTWIDTFTGNILNEAVQVTTLESLTLGNVALSKSVISQLPSFQRLTHLALTGSNQIHRSVEEGFANLKQLRTIDLQDMHLLRGSPDMLVHNTNLIEVNISAYRCTQCCFRAFSHFEKLCNLSVAHLEGGWKTALSSVDWSLSGIRKLRIGFGRCGGRAVFVPLNLAHLLRAPRLSVIHVNATVIRFDSLQQFVDNFNLIRDHKQTLKIQVHAELGFVDDSIMLLESVGFDVDQEYAFLDCDSNVSN